MIPEKEKEPETEDPDKQDDASSEEGGYKKANLSPLYSPKKNDDTASFRSLLIRIFDRHTNAQELNQDDPDTLSNRRFQLPTLPRKNFVHLWRSLNRFCEFSTFCVGADVPSRPVVAASPNGETVSWEGAGEDVYLVTTESRDRLYQSVTMVGTLLLQIGEVGQRVREQESRRKSLKSKSFDEPDDVAPPTTSQPTSFKASHSTYDFVAGATAETAKNDDDWSISFEQFLASILNENCLVNAFDQKLDIISRLEEYNRKALLTKQESIIEKSEFYV